VGLAARSRAGPAHWTKRLLRHPAVPALAVLAGGILTAAAGAHGIVEGLSVAALLAAVMFIRAAAATRDGAATGAAGSPGIADVAAGAYLCQEGGKGIEDGGADEAAEGCDGPLQGNIGNLLLINASLEKQVIERTASLESARNDLHAILDAKPAMIAYWDKGLINRYANRANERWYGATPGSLLGMHLRQLLGEELFDRDLTHIEAALRGEPRTFEQSMAKPDGSGYRHSLTHYVPDVERGEICGFYVLVYDVSELTENRLQLAGALRENEELLRTLDLHSNVSVTDHKGYITYVNENFCRVFGFRLDEVLGHPHSIVNSGVQNRAFWTQMWETIAAGQPWRGEICNRAKDGTLHWIDSIIAPFLGKDGRVQKYVSIGTDITAAKATEHRLRYNEGFLERIGIVAGVGGWEFDLRNQGVTWSPQTYRIHEVDAGYLPHADAEIDFYAPEVRPIIEHAISECIRHGTAWDLELPAVTAVGRPIWVRTVGVPELLHGKAVRIIGALQDVTARKMVDVQLQQSSERFAIAADSAGIGVWELDAANDRLVWDEWMYRIYGLPQTRETEDCALWMQALHPEDRERFESEIEAAFRGPADFNSEFRIVRPDGDIRYIKAASRAVRAPDGTSTRMTGVNFDVTDARRSEIEARRETASLLRTVLDAASEVSIIATDETLTIKVFNAGAERLLGYSSAEVVGKETLARIHDAAELNGHRESLETQGRSGAGSVIVDSSVLSRSHDRTYVRKDGSHLTVSLFITAMRSDEGNIVGYVCVAHDITQLNRDQTALRLAIARAEQANSAKSLFLANMSHEIRTPMNAVIGLSFLMGHTSLTAEQADFLAKIQVASNSLLSIITNILDLSKIEANELLVESTAFSLAELLGDVAAVMAVQADAKGIDFSMDSPRDLPEALTGDPTRLKQILINLLSNAIRFTDTGGVRFTIACRSATVDELLLAFTVADTGIGISPDAQRKLFAPFAQADGSITRRYGGTGLGLSIVKQLSKLLGGTVELDSVVGVGSTFTVTLPFGAADLDAFSAARGASVAQGRGALHGVRALVVDDSDINLEVAKRILELDGVQVSLAVDGQNAFERLQAEPEGFDVVFMDVQMPILDGYQATRRIRGELGLADLPIIAVTAGALSSERQRAIDAGMNDFICKPFDSQSLAQSILRHIRPADLRRTAMNSTTPVPVPPLDVAWPDIDGIDTADACARWCGDAPLFTSMLARLFDEFRQIDMPDDGEGPAAITLHGRRMHKLRGGACMLGDKAVHELAGRVEAACMAGDAERAAQLTAALMIEMQRLIENAQTVLAAAPRPREISAAASGELTPHLIDELDSLLRQQSLAAVDYFRSLTPQLLRLMGQASYDRMRLHIDNLQFEDASMDLRETTLQQSTTIH
jgi:PAS domain S-box-containing protein